MWRQISLVLPGFSGITYYIKMNFLLYLGLYKADDARQSSKQSDGFLNCLFDTTDNFINFTAAKSFCFRNTYN